MYLLFAPLTLDLAHNSPEKSTIFFSVLWKYQNTFNLYQFLLLKTGGTILQKLCL